MRKLNRKTIAGAFAACVAVFAMHALYAQQPAFKRTVLQRADLSAPGREGVTALVEIPPGAAVGRHTHFGEEIGYVIEGTLLLEVEGKPPVTLAAGDAYIVAAGKVHDGRNVGGVAGRIVATFVVEKGKPFATPLP